MTEDFIRLNVHEIGILLSALQLVDLREENQIAKDYGSVPALYNKLYSAWESMDRSGTVLRNDVVPSFWPYNKKVIKGETPTMQLTSKGKSEAMVVEFRPHNILTDKFVYTLKFMGDEMSKSMRLMSKKEMIETVNARLDLNYEVTDFLTEPQEYFPCAC